MKENEYLKFEEDDTSRMGINGKQVFFTKRINGKTTHNKIASEDESVTLKELQERREPKEIFVHVTEIPKIEEKNDFNKVKTNKTKISTKKRKQRKKKKRIAEIFITLLIIAGVFIFAMVSPIFNITKIEVVGNEKIETNTIISLSGIQTGENIFRISEKNIKDKIKQNTYINSVSINRKLPNILELKIEERKIEYQIKVMESYVYIDYQGYILELSSEKAEVPIISGIQTDEQEFLKINTDDINKIKRLHKNDFSILNTLKGIVNSAKSIDIYNLITEIKIEKGEYIIIIENEKKEVHLGDGSDIANKMLYLKAILEEEEKNEGIIYLDEDLNKGYKARFREEEKEENVVEIENESESVSEFE